MNLVPGTQRVTSDIAVGSSGKPIRVFAVNLISGGTASTLILRNGTDTSGTAYDQVDGTINVSISKSYAGGLRFPNGCFADVDANISYATIIYSEEF